jgi:hypothetical protein
LDLVVWQVLETRVCGVTEGRVASS